MSDVTDSMQQEETEHASHDHDRRDPRSGTIFDESSGPAGASRFLITLSIAGVGLSAVAMLVYALVVVIKIIYHAFVEAGFSVDGARHLAVEFIEMTDLFLLGMVLYVVAIGMYQLFINDDITIPSWMRVTNLDELKEHLVSVIIVLIAVSFLAEAVAWDGSTSILYIGAAVSGVILALGLYNLMHHFAKRDKH
ncbi:MAG: YqhA family protein [Thermomicrobiales bacterium]